MTVSQVSSMWTGCHMYPMMPYSCIVLEAVPEAEVPLAFPTVKAQEFTPLNIKSVEPAEDDLAPPKPVPKQSLF
eukprot:364007-Chlamydomonas_euryale.AAC.8